MVQRVLIVRDRDRGRGPLSVAMRQMLRAMQQEMRLQKQSANLSDSWNEPETAIEFSQAHLAGCASSQVVFGRSL